MRRGSTRPAATSCGVSKTWTGGNSMSSASRSSMKARAELVVPRSMPIFMIECRAVGSGPTLFSVPTKVSMPQLSTVSPTRAGFWGPACSATLKSFDVESDGVPTISRRVSSSVGPIRYTGKVREAGAPVAGHLLKTPPPIPTIFRPASPLSSLAYRGQLVLWMARATVSMPESGPPSWTN